MATVLAPPEQKVILRNVSWETYNRLLDERGDANVPRFNFDRGDLEIMSPSREHEEYKYALTRIVDVVTEELGINERGLGSTTFKREDVGRGFEPDACFYIQSVARLRAWSELDLLVDPPPDLIIEIDVTTDSMKKLGIYAALGVPEVWRYNGAILTILVLEGESYAEQDASLALPILTPAVLEQPIQEHATMDSIPWIRKLREWVREQVNTE